MAAYTPPCTRPSSCFTRSATGTWPFTKPSPCSVSSIPRTLWRVSFGKSSSAITRGRLPFALLMATFDQLPAEQRAILELVVGRGQTYDELSGMLGMPTARVRELAREALGDLAPATAGRVDSDWRGQIADYVLGQQTGPLSPAAQSVVRRRRIIGGVLAAAVVVVLILLITGVFSGGGGKKNTASTNTTTTGARTKFLREGVLRPVNGAKGTGIAVVLQQGNQVQLVVQATKLQPTTRTTAYEVWLYNSGSDAAQLGAQFTDSAGNLQGRGNVPANWQSFKYVVLSREKVGSNPKTPSALVLRARLAAIPTRH